ncbi:hypothetical protein [Mycobacterium sp. SA01]|uniref:hypothetical protein n=1 Tax=Mycobacterium sp. SA01 TaxID=3238820 RepID=UPI00351BB8C1
MNEVLIVCTADGKGKPHGRAQLAAARWDDQGEADMQLVKFGEPLSAGTEIRRVEYVSHSGYPIECHECGREALVDFDEDGEDAWRERLVKALKDGEIDVSGELHEPS